MNLLDLPVEIGIIVINYLDLKSKINIYYTCKKLRLFFAPCHVKKLVLSRNIFATVKTLNREFFQHFCHNIQELNLSGVPDLTVDSLKLHIKGLSHLKALDITFTNIYLSDLVEICPNNLKNISINFFKCPRKSRTEDIWEVCRNLFKEKHFISIELIVFEFLDSDMPLIFLQDVPSTKDLKIIVADNYKDFWDLSDEDAPVNIDADYQINFTKLSYIFRDCRVTHKTSRSLRGVSNLNFKQLEYIFIMYLEQIFIYLSPVFGTLFMTNCSDLRVEICPYLPLDFMLDGNIVFKAWNKATTVFNEGFFKSLLEELKYYFPTYICMHSRVKMKITKAPSDWYCIDASEGFDKVLEEMPERVTITNFCRRDGSVIRCNRPISFTIEWKTLNNITYMRLTNVCLKEEFFTVLFRECQKLNTLDIYVEKRGGLEIFRGCTLPLSSSIHLTKSLKNLKLTSEDIEYNILFETLSRCPSLENIHICEYERAIDDEIAIDSILLLIEQCENLYSLFIEADMSPETLTLLISPLKEAAQSLRRHHLCIEVCDCYRGWNPFVDVFNPSPLHIED